VKLGMRPLEKGEGYAVLELRGGTHISPVQRCRMGLWNSYPDPDARLPREQLI